MKKASIVVNPFYNNNRLFELSDPTINRDNCLYCYSELKKGLKQKGIDLATSDLHPPEQSDWVIYNEAPKKLPAGHDPKKSLLLLFETELILPHNWDGDLHQQFHKIFTWNDTYVDNATYYKINFSHKFPQSIQRVPFAERKLCTLVAGKKTSNHPKELYSQRLKSIRWFEKHHPQDFDYYGIGWNRIDFGSPFLNKVARKLKLEKWIPARPSVCYRGMIDNKIQSMKNYKFSICYENAEQISGYITEKIFDSFFAGCVPVYWGAPNITDHIPEDCFVDRRKFKNHQDLYQFLASMTESEFTKRLDAIERYLNSENSWPFKAESFSQTLIAHVEN